ncbi:MAG: hypothetical protein KKH94_10330 [Candidatus Omnitrophica bacterium]|nr:hypothetical protein [Candidatus Omnitrophota bacterium]
MDDSTKKVEKKMSNEAIDHDRNRILIEHMLDMYKQKVALNATTEREERHCADLKQENRELQEAIMHLKQKIDQTEHQMTEQKKCIDSHISIIDTLEKEKRELYQAYERRIRENEALKKELISVSQTAQESLAKNDHEFLKRLKIAEEHIFLQSELVNSEKANRVLSNLVSQLKSGLNRTQKKQKNGQRDEENN